LQTLKADALATGAEAGVTAVNPLDSTHCVRTGAYRCKSRSFGPVTPHFKPSPGLAVTADATLLENFTLCRSDEAWAQNPLSHKVWEGRPWVEQTIATNSCTPYYTLAKEGDDSHICAPTLADALGVGGLMDRERLFYQLYTPQSAAAQTQGPDG